MEELKNIPDDIKCLISGHLTGSLSADELDILKEWISESPENKLHFNKMRYAWIASEASYYKQVLGKSTIK